MNKIVSLTFNVSGITKADPNKLALLRQNQSYMNPYLVRESENEYDEYAIKICAAHPSVGEFKIGYVPTILASLIAPLLDNHLAQYKILKWTPVGGYRNYAGKYLNPGISLTVDLYV